MADTGAGMADTGAGMAGTGAGIMAGTGAGMADTGAGMADAGTEAMAATAEAAACGGTVGSGSMSAGENTPRRWGGPRRLRHSGARRPFGPCAPHEATSQRGL
jgi:hypothetical protein